MFVMTLLILMHVVNIKLSQVVYLQVYIGINVVKFSDGLILECVYQLILIINAKDNEQIKFDIK
jgi:hypothetical protein